MARTRSQTKRTGDVLYGTSNVVPDHSRQEEIADGPKKKQRLWKTRMDMLEDMPFDVLVEVFNVIPDISELI